MMTDLFDLPVKPVIPPPSEVPQDVAELFESLAVSVARRGFTRYSARAVLHRIRWEYNIERGDRDFKANNNWSAGLSRWFMERHPEYPKFFETRERRSDLY
jgi:hypothetical protein